MIREKLKSRVVATDLIIIFANLWFLWSNIRFIRYIAIVVASLKNYTQCSQLTVCVQTDTACIMYVFQIPTASAMS